MGLRSVHVSRPRRGLTRLCGCRSQAWMLILTMGLVVARHMMQLASVGDSGGSRPASVKTCCEGLMSLMFNFFSSFEGQQVKLKTFHLILGRQSEGGLRGQ